MTSQTIDLIFLVILLLSFLWGIKEGLVLSLFSIAMWAAHLFLVVHFTPDVAQLITHYVPDMQVVSYWTAIIIISAAVVVLGFVIKLFLYIALALTGQSLMGRLAGGIIGLIRGAILLLIIIVAISSRGWATGPTWQGSVFVSMLQPYTKQIYQAWDEHFALLEKASLQTEQGVVGQSTNNPYQRS